MLYCLFICVSELVMSGGDADTDASAVLAPQLESCLLVDLNPFVDIWFPSQNKQWGFYSCA